MELLNVVKARSIWLFDFADLNPSGRRISTELIEWLKAYYKFSKAPSSPDDIDPTKALAFLDGSFAANASRPIAVDLRMYTDGFVADTRSSTDLSDNFLDDLLQRAAKQFELGYKPTTIRKKMYLSELSLHCDKSLEDVCPKLKAFADKVTTALNRSTKFSSVGWWTDPEMQSTLGQFRFERKYGAAFSDQRYYSVAPLRTADHLKLLEELEEILSA